MKIQSFSNTSTDQNIQNLRGPGDVDGRDGCHPWASLRLSPRSVGTMILAGGVGGDGGIRAAYGVYPGVVVGSVRYVGESLFLLVVVSKGELSDVDEMRVEGSS